MIDIPTFDDGVNTSTMKKVLADIDAVLEGAPGASPSDFVADPTGAVTDQDDEARAAIIAIRDALVEQGILEAS
jgi:hypothetical protein